ncbi:MAG: flavodoxin family protein [Promethearchaeota archaeon]
MRILIVYYSQSGNTKKVVDLVKERLKALNHDVTVRNALTARPEQVLESDLVLIGTPVHGYILFGQRPTKEVSEFLEQLPQDLKEKPAIGFATYLFFPSRALNPIKRAIEARNGKIIGLIAQRRTKKSILMKEIVGCIQQQEVKE